MLVLLRIVLVLALLHVLRLAYDNAQSSPETGDIANAGYLALALLLGLANAAVWAPFLGAKMAGPLTGLVTESTYVEENNLLLKGLHHCRARRATRTALCLALIEGVLHPDRPQAFLLGLDCARRGSWLEKVFAAEVWRFDNLKHCSRAYRVLRRHGLDPRPHHNQEVNLALLALERSSPSDPRPPVTLAETSVSPPPKRDPRIRLFDTDPKANKPTATSGSPEDTPS